MISSSNEAKRSELRQLEEAFQDRRWQLLGFCCRNGEKVTIFGDPVVCDRESHEYDLNPGQVVGLLLFAVERTSETIVLHCFVRKHGDQGFEVERLYALPLDEVEVVEPPAAIVRPLTAAAA